MRRDRFAVESSEVVFSGEGGGDERSWCRMELRFEIEVDILEEAPEVVQNYCGVEDLEERNGQS